MNLIQIHKKAERIKVLRERKERCDADFKIALEYVSDYFNVPKKLILSKKRFREYTFPRQVIYFVLRRLGHGLQNIGDQFNTDHTTIVYGKDRIEELFKLGEKGYANDEDLIILENVNRILNQVYLDNYMKEAS